MKREFTKQRDAARIAASQFKVGTEVAIVNTHWGRRIAGKRKVTNVYKTGNFVISTHDGTRVNRQQWRPQWDGVRAYLTGKETYRFHEHLEIWSPAIEAEIAERKAQAARAARLTKVVEAISGRHAAERITDAQVTALEATLGLDAPDQDSPRSDGSMDTSE